MTAFAGVVLSLDDIGVINSYGIKVLPSEPSASNYADGSFLRNATGGEHNRIT